MAELKIIEGLKLPPHPGNRPSEEPLREVKDSITTAIDDYNNEIEEKTGMSRSETFELKKHKANNRTIFWCGLMATWVGTFWIVGAVYIPHFKTNDQTLEVPPKVQKQIQAVMDEVYAEPE